MEGTEQKAAGPGPEISDRDLILIGILGKPRGNRGEIFLDPVSDYPERFDNLVEVVLEFPEAEGRVRLEKRGLERVRWIKDRLVLKFEDCESIGAAEIFRGAGVLIPEDEAIDLEDGSYFHHHLMGLRVETENGRRLGEVTGIVRTAAGDILEVMPEKADSGPSHAPVEAEADDGSEEMYLIPAVDEICYDVDLEDGVIRVRPPEGLLEINR